MDKSFDIPISVVIGVSTAHDLRSLEEVHAFLNDWPHSRRGPIHGTALRACKAAMEGSVPAETARQAFVGSGVALEPGIELAESLQLAHREVA